MNFTAEIDYYSFCPKYLLNALLCESKLKEENERKKGKRLVHIFTHVVTYSGSSSLRFSINPQLTSPQQP